MLYTPRAQAFRLLGQDAVLPVDPRRIENEIGQRYRLYGRMLPLVERGRSLGRPGAWADRIFGQIAYGLEPFFLSPAQTASRAPVEDTSYYRLVADFARHRHRPQDSLWFAQLSAALRDTGTARHKGIRMDSEARIVRFLNGYVGGLFDSLEREGFVEGRADTGTAVIGPKGEILKAAAGCHRFAAARVLGVAPVPLRIMGVDAGWARATGADRGGAALVAAIAEVGRRHAA